MADLPLLRSYALDRWFEAAGSAPEVFSAVTGEAIARVSSAGLDVGAMAEHARRVGGPALRRLTFHERAGLLKKLALHLGEHKAALYALSTDTGATRTDSWIDIDGGIGTLFVYASKGRRELPASTFLLDGAVEGLSKRGSFVGRHVFTSLRGVAVHINAFNFPVWGLLEKLGPSILAGVPVIAKPATATAPLAEGLAKLIVASGILPPGAFQFVSGSVHDLFDHLTGQDVVSFTGSATTAATLQRHPKVATNAVRFVAERDSLNASILGPDAVPGTPEFDLFVKAVVAEMTVKAGQKCTAIRRALVPEALVEPVGAAIAAKLAEVKIGHPGLETTKMGALASLAQRRDVLAQVEKLKAEADVICGETTPTVDGADAEKGAFLAPILLRARDAASAHRIHEVEAFGPVSTLMGYRDLDDAIELAHRGEGSLVASLVTYDPNVARDVVLGIAASHGRILVLDRDCARESTGHGSPLPQLVHGGPGRAGGGEEMGGVRGVHHYMQRTALQGSPAMLTAIGGSWIKGAPEIIGEVHPFRLTFDELELGRSFRSQPRVVTLEDIEHFAHFTGDTFYAHMDEEAVKGHPFFPGRVAHGYLLLAFAAGLFVEPARGPVLANYGLDELRFLKPVQPGEAIEVRLTVKSKNPRNADYGEVRWDVEITSAGETCATYDLLTMNAHTA